MITELESTHDYMLGMQHVIYILNGCFAPSIGFVRNGEVVAVASVPDYMPYTDGLPCLASHEYGLETACALGHIGYESDEIVVATAGYSTSAPLNPMTGAPWTAREIYEVAVNDGGLGGLVKTNLIITSKKKHGPIVLSVHEYVPTEGGDIEWKDFYTVEDDTPHNVAVVGNVPRMLRSALDSEGRLLMSRVTKDEDAGAVAARMRKRLREAEDRDERDYITNDVLNSHGYSASLSLVIK